jgi:ribulose-phosphate 3-epimerase
MTDNERHIASSIPPKPASPQAPHLQDPAMAHLPPRRLTIAPSLLAADFARLKDEAQAIEAAGADWLHLDIMDGHFVPNLSFGPLILKALRPHTKLPFDVHLMISPVDASLAAFAEAGADHISLHPEAGPHPHRSLQAIRALGKRAGVVLNPGTPVEAVAWLFELADIVLVMTVNPGAGGQAFLPSQLAKIATLRGMIDAADHPITLGVDGGIGPDTARLAIEAGADTLIAGTSVFHAADYTAAITSLRAAWPAA